VRKIGKVIQLIRCDGVLYALDDAGVIYRKYERYRLNSEQFDGWLETPTDVVTLDEVKSWPI